MMKVYLQVLLWTTALGPGRFSSDDGAKGNRHAVPCTAESSSGGLACGQRMRECRSLLCSCMCSGVLEGDGLDPATEEFVALFQPIGVQLRDNCLGLIGDDYEFDVDLFILHRNPSRLQSYACSECKVHPGEFDLKLEAGRELASLR
jgi:hypothetical protein